MLKIFKLKPKLKLYSPVIGVSIGLEEVADKVFASKMMGDGIAFCMQDDVVYSPCDAKVILIPNTKHAIGLDINGIEVLIHVGLDTVNLNGEGFESLVTVGSVVKRGTPLLKIDLDFMKSKNIDLTTPMVITTEKIKLAISKPSTVNLDSVVIEAI